MLNYKALIGAGAVLCVAAYIVAEWDFSAGGHECGSVLSPAILRFASCSTVMSVSGLVAVLLVLAGVALVVGGLVARNRAWDSGRSEH